MSQDLAAIFTGQTRPLRDYGLDLTQATLKEWAMKQGRYTVMWPDAVWVS